MQDKKNQEKTKLLPEFEKEITEILVANGRSFQPFIRTFNYTGENVSKVNLGILVGVFEVDEKSEDSAYIVNFLASVAKKEYFNNPRRGAIESFEAALHKVNLALAELVKHGNVAWLGKLHGALGVLEKNHLHFSVAGEAAILLLRNTTLSNISEGLASEEATTHPIKTFVEVSSGRLMVGDQVILSSPELFDLFSEEDIEKNASRMDKERFSQFLKTALRNELDMAGTVLVNIEEGVAKAPEKPVKKKAEATQQLYNVFSQAAFTQPKEEHPLAADIDSLTSFEEKRDEYIDTKTGHIYVQGSSPSLKEESPFIENTRLAWQEWQRSFGQFLANQNKWLRKGRKQLVLSMDSLSEQTKAAALKTYRTLRKQWKKKTSETVAPKEEEFIQEETITFSSHTETFSQETPDSTPSPEKPRVAEEEVFIEEKITYDVPASESKEEVPSFIKEKLAKFYQKNTPSFTPTQKVSAETKISQFIENTLTYSSRFWEDLKSIGGRSTPLFKKYSRLLLVSSRLLAQNLVTFYRKLAPLQKKGILGILCALVLVPLLGFYGYEKFSNKKTTPVQEETPASTSTPSLPIEKGVVSLSSPMTTSSQGEALFPLVLGNELYIVNKENILQVRTNKTYPLPNNENAKLASAMDDLRLLFILTKNNTLYAWSPINGNFSQNTLTLPENAQVESIGTYLTYLYVLESTTDQVYRFPRAEGGFGQSSKWLRDFVSIEQESKMSVSETIFLSPTPTTLQSYFQGRQTRSLEAPQTPFKLTEIYTSPEVTQIYALDTENKRVVVWNQEGSITVQYVHEELGTAKALAVNESTNELFVVTENDSLLTFKLK